MRKAVAELMGALALAAAVTANMTEPAAAQTAPRGKQAGDIVVGLSAIGVLPTNGGHVDAIGGKPEASNSATAQLDFSYFFTPHIALNLIAATTQHDVSVRNSAIGNVDLGHVWALPPTLTLQLHPLPQSRLSPYAGLGVNYTVFYGEGGGRNRAVSDVSIGNSWGLALNAGVDYELAPRWALNFDVKKIFFLEPDVKVDTALGRINARADINPWVVGAGVRYRF
jgi:outer membrane protein